MGPLDYLLPMRMSEDLKAVKIEEWMRFIEQIASQSIYEVLILDIDEGIRGVYELLRMCTEIHVAVIKEEVAQAKMFQFEEELHLMGYDDVRHKMIKKRTGRMIKNDRSRAAPCKNPGQIRYDKGHGG